MIIWYVCRVVYGWVSFRLCGWVEGVLFLSLFCCFVFVLVKSLQIPRNVILTHASSFVMLLQRFLESVTKNWNEIKIIGKSNSKCYKRSSLNSSFTWQARNIVGVICCFMTRSRHCPLLLHKSNIKIFVIVSVVRLPRGQKDAHSEW